MRILHITNDVTDLGNGIINVAIDLAAGQAEQGHMVAIASAGGGYEPLLHRLKIRHFFLDQTRRPLQLIRAFVTLRNYLRDLQPDIVHAHSRTGLVLAWLVTRFSRHPLVAHVHNVHERESVIMRLADRVIVVSESVGRTMRAMGIRETKIRVVHNGPLQTPRLPSLDAVSPASIEHPAIVTACGMSHRKGIADLIAAFDQLAPQILDAHLYLVGDGPQMQLFRQQAKASRYESRIHFEGFQPTPQSYMLAADIFVLASRRESFGLVLVEARQAGCAIIASDVDGIPEALDQGAAGILFPPSDIRRLSQEMLHLLKDNHKRVSLQQKSLTGIERFHYTTMAKETSRIYSELLLERPSPRRGHMEVPMMSNE
jgi:glycosyltransferase involved in cell wall biosynthesis